jgi:hypothetical protein
MPPAASGSPASPIAITALKAEAGRDLVDVVDV